MEVGYCVVFFCVYNSKGKQLRKTVDKFYGITRKKATLLFNELKEINHHCHLQAEFTVYF